MLHIPEIHRWCNTYWALGSQHGCWASLVHIPTTRHWWGSNVRPLVPQAMRMHINNFCLVPWFEKKKTSWIRPVVLLNWDVTSYYQNWASLKSPTDWSIQTEKFSSSLCQVMYNSTCSLNGPLKWSPKLDFKKPGQLIGQPFSRLLCGKLSLCSQFLLLHFKGRNWVTQENPDKITDVFAN